MSNSSLAGYIAEMDRLSAEIVDYLEGLPAHWAVEQQHREEAFNQATDDGHSVTAAKQVAEYASRDAAYHHRQAQAHLAALRFRYDHLRFMVENAGVR